MGLGPIPPVAGALDAAIGGKGQEDLVDAGFNSFAAAFKDACQL